jgi:hypothetical protein
MKIDQSRKMEIMACTGNPCGRYCQCPQAQPVQYQQGEAARRTMREGLKNARQAQWVKDVERSCWSAEDAGYMGCRRRGAQSGCRIVVDTLLVALAWPAPGVMVREMSLAGKLKAFITCAKEALGSVSSEAGVDPPVDDTPGATDPDERDLAAGAPDDQR